MTIIDALDDESLFASWFDAASWANWRVFLKALFAIPLASEAEENVFRHFTHRHTISALPYKEAWLVCGRRSGKSINAAVIATYLAAFIDYSDVLQRGEVGTLAVVSADRKQSRTILRYIKGFLEQPMLAPLVVNQTADSIELFHHGCQIMIETHTCSFKSTRGYTLIGCLADEIGYWEAEDTAQPDKEVVAAIRPGLSTVPTAVLVALSSPYARRGQLWNMYQRHFGRSDSPFLLWQGSSRELNPSLPQSVVDDAMAEDEASAKAEYLALFRTDVESYVSLDTINSCTIAGRTELPPFRHSYRGFVDPSGGSSDSMTLAIAHAKNGKSVLDAVVEKKVPFNPEVATEEFSVVLKRYGLDQVTGDRYAGSWPASRFLTHGISYIPSDLNKSEIYLSALPLLNAGRVELLENARLSAQIQGLERRTQRGGKDSVDHSPGSHDDLANAALGVLLSVSGSIGSDCGGVF